MLNTAELEQRLQRHGSQLPTLLRDAVTAANDARDALRFCVAAAALRELLRAWMQAMAPDAQLKHCAWFEPDPDSKTGVTRRHRIQFSLYGCIDPALYPTPFVEHADERITRLLKQLDGLSQGAHLTRSRLEGEAQQGVKRLEAVLHSFSQLLGLISKAQQGVGDRIKAHLGSKLDHLFTPAFFGELDAFSPHTRPTGVCDVAFGITGRDRHAISFSGSGRVEWDWQGGSDRDCRRGDGWEGSPSFPFSFSGKLSNTDLQSIEILPEDVDVDTSEYEGSPTAC